ncbi:MAG: DUF484 family protein [Rhodobacteraceae bacterium]|nr:DUF484 family protein [Paracoccaceae bacterium]
MNKQTTALDQLRDQLLAEPEMILQDHDLMKALAAANERQMGANVVDLRGLAMERLEQRFGHLESTHRQVIAAAYENISGTRLVQRAVVALLEPKDFSAFLNCLGTEIAEILKVDMIRLCLETPVAGNAAQTQMIEEYGNVIGFYAPGSIAEYLTDGRNITARPVTLRQIARASSTLYGEKAPWIRSEALLKLDLGGKNLPGMLALGAEDPHLFHPNQGTDLLTFLSGVFERILRRWLEG